MWQPAANPQGRIQATTTTSPRPAADPAAARLPTRPPPAPPTSHVGPKLPIERGFSQGNECDVLVPGHKVTRARHRPFRPDGQRPAHRVGAFAGGGAVRFDIVCTDRTR